ncbi:hypothetical protein BpHYR1_038347 [Brachionus plicatilis]|uniref:Uncharacterized protein n=1 Tax=Brachionus plicatilis TaxID=10195 RepID=A0A3M7RDM8_BRAPC|nr:hypothetical protein BpHYR1_038347 [Brachionus plicatilis]
MKTTKYLNYVNRYSPFDHYYLITNTLQKRMDWLNSTSLIIESGKNDSILEMPGGIEQIATIATIAYEGLLTCYNSSKDIVLHADFLTEDLNRKKSLITNTKIS